MAEQTLASALEREHREIDAGIDEFVAGLESGTAAPGPMARAMAGLRRHIYLEEEFLFPPMRTGGLMAAIFVMVREHGQMWRLMDALDRQLADGSDPAAVLDTCQQLIGELKAHNPKEEQIIYPQADGALNGAASEELKAFLASGTMPDGWVCKGA
jgi:iron-sulfur cluster repair protein YtfE (RIC family)